MVETSGGDVTRSRVGGIRMNSTILRTLSRASRNAKDKDGEPMKVTSWIRETAVADARVIIETMEAGQVRKLILRVRMRQGDRDLIRRASEIVGLPYSNFMLRSAEARAAREARAAASKITSPGTGSLSAPRRSAQGR